MCHHVTSKETYTKLVLTRDSFGRVGTPTKNESSSNADKVMDPNFLPFIKFVIINTNVTESFYDY